MYVSYHYKSVNTDIIWFYKLRFSLQSNVYNSFTKYVTTFIVIITTFDLLVSGYCFTSTHLPA